ncbi:hypothetical protein Gotur_011298 [Gossypium turneri]
MMQTHLASGAPYIELYVQFTSPNDVLASGVRDIYMSPGRHSVNGLQNTEQPMFGSGVGCTSPTRHSVGGWDMYVGGSMFDTENTYWRMTSNSSGWQSTSNWGRYEMPRRRDDVLPTTSTGKGTSYAADNCGLEDDSDMDPP